MQCNGTICIIVHMFGGEKQMLLCRDFKFDEAHYLVNYHGKCERLHGHTYHMSVVLKGEPDHEGMIFDF